MKKRFSVSLMAALLLALVLSLAACGRSTNDPDPAANLGPTTDSTITVDPAPASDPTGPAVGVITATPTVEQISVPNVSPQSLLELYQSGEWNGEGWLWSEDFSTQVANWNGSLHYIYRDPAADTADSGITAYTYGGSTPAGWWNELVASDTLEFELRNISCTTYLNQGANVIADNDLFVQCNLDLPDGKIDEDVYGRLIDTFPEDDGLWAITETGVYHFDSGNLLESWSLPMADNSFLRTRNAAYSFKADYAYDGSRILELLPNGETKVVLENVNAGTSYEGMFWAYYVQNGNLVRWLNWNGKITTTTLIKGVIETSGVHYPTMVRKTDGYAYVFKDQGHYAKASEIELFQLGRGSLEHYWARWNKFREDHDWNLAEFADYCQTGTGLDVTTACFGQRVMVREGATYYESADLAGSGRTGSAFYSNQYTANKLYAYGFANLDDNDRVTDYEVYNWSDGVYGRPAPEFCQDADSNIWVLIRVDNHKDGALGWFSADDVYFLPLEEV